MIRAMYLSRVITIPFLDLFMTNYPIIIMSNTTGVTSGAEIASKFYHECLLFNVILSSIAAILWRAFGINLYVFVIKKLFM